MGPLELGARGGRAGGGARAARRSPPLRIAVCVCVCDHRAEAAGEAREACVPYLCPEGERRSGEEALKGSSFARSYAPDFSREPADGRHGGPTGALSPPTTHGMHLAPPRLRAPNRNCHLQLTAPSRPPGQAL